VKVETVGNMITNFIFRWLKTQENSIVCSRRESFKSYAACLSFLSFNQTRRKAYTYIVKELVKLADDSAQGSV